MVVRRSFLVESLSIILLLVFTATDIRAQVNLLVNPGFENDLEGWFEWDSEAGVAKGRISSEYSHGGSHSGKRWLMKPGELTYSCFIQELDIEASAGDLISVSGWMMSPSEDPLRNGAEAFLVIEFWRGAEKIRYPESKRLNSQSDWKEYKVSGIVPEGTNSVKVCCFLFGFDGTKGAIYFDDLKVEIKPKKAPY